MATWTGNTWENYHNKVPDTGWDTLQSVYNDPYNWVGTEYDDEWRYRTSRILFTTPPGNLSGNISFTSSESEWQPSWSGSEDNKGKPADFAWKITLADDKTCLTDVSNPHGTISIVDADPWGTTGQKGYFYSNGSAIVTLEPETQYALWIFPRESEKQTFHGWNMGSPENGYLTVNFTITPVTYTISYNANGGSGAPAAQTKTHGTATTLSSNYPTRSGYSCQGWATTQARANAGTVDYTKNQQYTIDADLTLWAVWKADTYSIKYDKNGFDVSSGLPTEQTKTHDVNLKLSTSIPIIRDKTVTGYTVTFDATGGITFPDISTSFRTEKRTFKNWNTNSQGTGSSYDSGTDYTNNQSVTLYLQSNNPTYVNGAISLPIPEKPGHTFLGWTTSKTDINFLTDPYTPTKNITVYAVWDRDTQGLVNIDDGSSWKYYTVWIDNGSSWIQYVPYIDDGNEWKLCGK